MKIYTHDEAALIVDKLEEVLSKYDIYVPSPEDDEREPDNMVGLYGSTYSDLLDEIEDRIKNIIARVKNGDEIIYDEFSGTFIVDSLNAIGEAIDKGLKIGIASAASG